MIHSDSNARLSFIYPHNQTLAYAISPHKRKSLSKSYPKSFLVASIMNTPSFSYNLVRNRTLRRLNEEREEGRKSRERGRAKSEFVSLERESIKKMKCLEQISLTYPSRAITKISFISSEFNMIPITQSACLTLHDNILR